MPFALSIPDNSIYQNSSLLYHRAGWFFLSSFIPDTIGLSAAFIVRHTMPPFLRQLRRNLIPTIGSANICPRCPVLALSASEIDTSRLFGIHFYSLNIVHCSVVFNVENAILNDLGT